AGKIKAKVVPVKMAATLITLAFGGSAGKEGPCAQIGAGIGSSISDIFNLAPKDRKKIVVCGISAGFAAVFGTPIAGAIFGVEVLAIGSLLYDVLLPSFISGITAYEISSNLGINYFHNPIILSPVINESFLLKMFLGGVFFGFCSMLFIEALHYTEKISFKIRIWKPLKAFLGGLFLVGLTYIFSTQYLGLGLDTIEANLKGEQVIWYAFLIKILFTVITLNFGGSGGIITPIFFVGSAAGSVYAKLTNLDTSTVSSIGMVALLAGCANTPISASIMSVELFGPSMAPYATVACIISFLITGHRSVYPSQILSFKKSASMDIELGKEIEDTEIITGHAGFRLIRLKSKLIYKAFFSKFAFRKQRNRNKEK
ncbi:MAG: chloride channel protein, partial [Ignavibacteria bacterium]